MRSANSAPLTTDAMAVHMLGPGEPRLRRSSGTVSLFDKVRSAAARGRAASALLTPRATRTRQPLGSR
jgi:hypothetical protein